MTYCDRYTIINSEYSHFITNKVFSSDARGDLIENIGMFGLPTCGDAFSDGSRAIIETWGVETEIVADIFEYSVRLVAREADVVRASCIFMYESEWEHRIYTDMFEGHQAIIEDCVRGMKEATVSFIQCAQSRNVLPTIMFLIYDSGIPEI